MTATITTCPFQDTDHLSEITDKGMESVSDKIASRLETLKSDFPDLSHRLSQLDDLYLAAIIGATNEVIKNTICLYCDKDMECHQFKC